MKSPIETRNHLLTLGYEVIATKSDEGFKAVVFKNNEFLREGDHIYKNWNDAIEQTEKKFYQYLKK